MSNLTQTMEQLGSNSTLKSEVLDNRIKVLQRLGIEKQLSLALINKNSAQLSLLAKVRKQLCCFILPPSSSKDERIINTIIHSANLKTA
jgi:hypothetical protein